jgi:hypothetical protein
MYLIEKFFVNKNTVEDDSEPNDEDEIMEEVKV